MTTIVFLDIDGVLNSTLLAESGNWRSWDSLDPEAVTRLNRVHEVTGCKYVLSSTWRFSGLELVKFRLERAGFTGTLIDVTPSGGFNRGEEINVWLAKNRSFYDVDQFVIVDDDADMGDLMPWLVQTSFADGLQDRHVDEMIQRLS